MREPRLTHEAAAESTRDSIVRDYRIAFLSRQASLLGRKEVFTGKAKFGIFGDGKEVAQVALARAFEKGDWRSGYYRDQTLMFALGMSSVEEFFAQLYAHADVEADPSSAGRSMTAHFGTRTLGADGRWHNLSDSFNSSADVSPTASQMPRVVGLGYASKLYRELAELRGETRFSRKGREVAFATIGNASCAEGLFWESVNAIGVLRLPVVISIWDDDYGISVPNEYQLTKADLSKILTGFQREPGSADGYDIHRVRGWDYPALCETYLNAVATARQDSVPQVIHVIEMTQPQGHSTSGSHERYKDEDRLAWEQDYDCIVKMRDWMIEHGVARAEELDRVEAEDRQLVMDLRSKAWEAFQEPIRKEREELVGLLRTAARASTIAPVLTKIITDLERKPSPARRDLARALGDALFALRREPAPTRRPLIDWNTRQEALNEDRYGSHLHSASTESALNIPQVDPVFRDDAPLARGFEVLNRCFDAALKRDPRVIAFGEDVGKLGDVNQGFMGLQERYGAQRVADTGIREATIVGQAIGLAMRGLRPVAEIQYLDYLLYALQIISDDLATLHYRTKGGQKAPVIIRTRGHRLEGIWHAGSPMAGIINLVRGIHVCVPRDMTRAVGFYNRLLQADEPAIVVEVLNGYRLKEKLPSNVGEFTVPLGVPEVLRAGSHVTVATYGACCRVALDAAAQLAEAGIEAEVIDVQTLLPFDLRGAVLASLKKTGRVVFLDEDVPGGTTAYMMQQVLDEQGGYWHLDSQPQAVSARAHRPAYGSDGDYWSKPNREQVFRAVYALMHEADPRRFPEFF